MSAPFFTISIPTRNRARMLRTALKSLLWQTCQDFECIIVDDGSTDDTPEVLEEFARLGKFFWHRHPEQRTVPPCRNYAVRNGSGRFITFLDDDDIWLPTRLEEFKKAAQSRPEVGFWYSNAYLWRYDRIVGKVFDPGRQIPEGRVPGYYAIGDKHLPYLSTTMAITREAFDQVGLFKEDLQIMVDTELCVRVLAAGFPVGVLRQPLAVRRLHDSQVTRNYERAFQESMMTLQSARAPENVERAYRDDRIAETAVYLIKSLEPEKALAFLERSEMRRNLRYFKFYCFSLVPVSLLALLRWFRKIYLEKAPIPALADEGSRQADRLVRTILP